MRMRLLEKYNEFRGRYMDPRCSAQQVKDMKCAYMIGALDFAALVFNLQSNNIIMSEDIQMVKDLMGELNKFARDMREGNV